MVFHTHASKNGFAVLADRPTQATCIGAGRELLTASRAQGTCEFHCQVKGFP